MNAVVIGGSNGIGLAIVKELIEKGYFVSVFDCKQIEEGILPEDSYEFVHCNLLDYDEDIFSKYIIDPELSVLMITAGIGRVADFNNIYPVEIKKIMTINAISIITLIKLFYSRIDDKHDFYCGVMGSIAGLVSSPLFSVYSASKAALCRFVESVNIELESHEVSNRILCVSPVSFKGSCFNGGENRLELLEGLADEIIVHLLQKEPNFLPDYEILVKGILDRYQTDPHAFGLQSYQYKVESGRLDDRKGTIVGYLSGTFDLFHIGHLNLLKRAKAQCDYLIVGVHNSGAWKGKETFIPLEERKQIVGACKYVDKVVDSCREDSDAWDLWHYDRLFVGSDYKGTDRFNRYEIILKEKGVEIIYFPYTKGTSSTQLRDAVGKNESNTHNS